MDQSTHASLDLDISPRDVQAIGSTDETAAFFARLGYDTNARMLQTPGNIGLTAESVIRSMKRIELIADAENLFRSTSLNSQVSRSPVRER